MARTKSFAGEITEKVPLKKTTRRSPTLESRPPVTTIEAAIRRNYALKMRLAYLSYEEVAQAVVDFFGRDSVPKGYDARYAAADIKRELANVTAESLAIASHVRDLELLTLDQMEAALVPYTVRDPRKPRWRPDIGAIQTRLKIMEQRAKLIPGLHPRPELKAIDASEGGVFIYIPPNNRDDDDKYLPDVDVTIEPPEMPRITGVVEDDD